jgi:hypothetical protein
MTFLLTLPILHPQLNNNGIFTVFPTLFPKQASTRCGLTLNQGVARNALLPFD